ncbi:MAG TPA: thioredoxin family protein [Bacteroidia bacterium]|jgi:thiol-disulfide isomerase/thioredoxin
MKKFTPFLFAALLISSFSFAQNRSITFEHGTFAELLAKAKKENKIIYIDCYTVWCGPCKWMAKNVFTNDTVADFYNKNFVNAKIDMENGEGIEIAKKYHIRAYPTMLFINADGEQIHRTCGSSPVKTFMLSGEDALSPNKQLATYARNFNNGKVDAAFATTYFAMLQRACQSLGKEVNDYFSTVKKDELNSRSNWNIIYRYINDYRAPAFIAMEENKAGFSKLYTVDSVESKLNDVYSSGLYSAFQNNDMTGYAELQAKLRASKTKDAEMIILEADVTRYKHNHDWANYATLAAEYVNKYSSNNAGDLNSFAWAFYENVSDKSMLDKAAAWAKKATELDDNYPYNDTYAALLYKLGKKAEAKVAAQKAIDIAKKNGDDYKETSTLLEKIEALK